jgi:chromate transporter
MYVAVGVAGPSLAGQYLVLVLLACGLVELWLSGVVGEGVAGGRRGSVGSFGAPLAALVATGGVSALAWTAIKVGALSFGGGFVIVPLMQGDAVHVHHWMTQGQFLNAVALGQVTPGPVVATIAAVGYAARGVGGGLLAAAIAFTPSFLFVLIGGPRFGTLRLHAGPRAFLDGAGPAAIGAILGAAIPLAGALREWWQFVLLGLAAVALLLLRRGVVSTLVGAGAVGAVLALAGAALPS